MGAGELVLRVSAAACLASSGRGRATDVALLQVPSYPCLYCLCGVYLCLDTVHVLVSWCQLAAFGVQS